MNKYFLVWLACLLLSGGAAHAAVPFAVAQYREVSEIYSVDGLVEAARQATVSAQINGRVVEIKFDAGDTVYKGQVILRIDQREALQSLAGSQAQVLQAQAAMQNAKAAYERAVQLYAQKFISQAALDKAETDYKVAQAQAAASEAGAGQARLSQGYTAVLAPYSGIVAQRLVEVGEMVSPGKPLMTGFDPAKLRIIASVPQDKLLDIGPHPEAMVEVPSLRQRIKPASVSIQPVADARTHSTQVRVYLPENETGFHPGMFVRVHFVTGKAQKLTIPASAVLRRSEVVAVYVLDETGAVKLRQVRLGAASFDGAQEVLSGLNPGEKVALDPITAGMR
jgi:RND family efflux transporter MFP subunit